MGNVIMCMKNMHIFFSANVNTLGDFNFNGLRN